MLRATFANTPGDMVKIQHGQANGSVTPGWLPAQHHAVSSGQWESADVYNKEPCANLQHACLTF